MSRRKKSSKELELLPKQTVLLDIPPRLQWDNGNGYCGETSLQSIGLYYGAWISQQLIRDINKGEYLLQKMSIEDHRDPIRTLTRFHFTYDEWDWVNSPKPQFRNFCPWIKGSILRKHPVMFAIYLPNMEYDDYDHIVPAVGIQYTSRNEYDPDDILMYYDLYEKTLIKGILSEDKMGSTRTSIVRRQDAADGCIPIDVSYGIAITGILDENRVTLPVRLVVSACDEPNLAFQESPIEMTGTVIINNLTLGKKYVLLRYSSFKNVPTKGDGHAYLQSVFDTKHEFTAENTSYVYEDPKKIPTKGSVYYRCIAEPVDVI